MLTIDEIKKMPVKGLRELAASLGIDASDVKKKDIIEMLLSLGEPDDSCEDSPGKSDSEPDGVPDVGSAEYSYSDKCKEILAKAAADFNNPDSNIMTIIPEGTQMKQAGKNFPGRRPKNPGSDDFEDGAPDKAGFDRAGTDRAGRMKADNVKADYVRAADGIRGVKASGYRSDVQGERNREGYGERNREGHGERNREGHGDYFEDDRDTAQEKRRNAARTAGNANASAEAPSSEPEMRTPDVAEFTDNGESPEDKSFDCYGILELSQSSFGFLRAETMYPSAKDIFVAPPFIKKHALRTGDMICGKAKLQPKEYNAQFALASIDTVNGVPVDELGKRPTFDSLIPIYPDSQLILETRRDEYATRIIDLVAPIGKGQRGVIVSPPKAGKTELLKLIANSITRNYPDIHLIMLLIDERPEEVTDIKESVNAMVVASTFDEMTSRHIAVSEFCLEHAERLVEMGQDVVILMDSITRLARAYNQEIPPTGRSLSGGLDPGALYKPKKFFGAARNIKGGGSLTIIATALVDTGSRLDDVIYEEFKGTGNMELHLDRSLAEKRIFPSIDVTISGTRKEELLLSPKTLEKIYALRRYFSSAISSKDVIETVIVAMSKTENNQKFIDSIKIPEQKRAASQT
ncbi:MAG: transcription termination factor Rho [Clostridia bacterium]|nr:transcription termination factor Rho [Clostridia bacterium]